MPRVFVSHGARDANLAAAIARALRKHGVEAFDISDNDPAEGYVRQTIKSAIRKADGFVLVLGAPDTAASGWTGYELGMAEALGKPALLLLSHKHAAGELPLELAGLPIVPFDPAHPELAAHEVVDRLLAAACAILWVEGCARGLLSLAEGSAGTIRGRPCFPTRARWAASGR